ncbi:MAG: ABC transporter substrate-binding protein [Caulobacteraceae bacterium]|nr:ABC transporter substrate-binding protein [Caulobacteraceae bacterium]
MQRREAKIWGWLTAQRAIARLATAVGLAAILTAISAPPAALAQPADPAAAQIDSFDAALIDTMKAGKTLGPQGRYKRLEPVVARVFDIPTMIRFAVGPSWASMTPAQQQALIQAFNRLTVASYAHNFNSYSGQRFQINPNVATKGVDKGIQTQLISPGDAPVSITYRMRQSGGVWKVIDVSYGAISQLTTRRSDFAGPLASGGADGLVAHLNALADKQMK